uniref:Potassium voltage-gated channel subfamily E regulatory subunit 3 n=1 Tax=Terrapene triunguis TaxID=2587831 RepID=A0A674JBM0_9SAUR
AMHREPLHSHDLPGSSPSPDVYTAICSPAAQSQVYCVHAYMYILFVMILFAATVGSLILGYTKSRRVDKRSDPYHVYIKNRVSMI